MKSLTLLLIPLVLLSSCSIDWNDNGRKENPKETKIKKENSTLSETIWETKSISLGTSVHTWLFPVNGKPEWYNQTWAILLLNSEWWDYDVYNLDVIKENPEQGEWIPEGVDTAKLEHLMSRIGNKQDINEDEFNPYSMVDTKVHILYKKPWEQTYLLREESFQSCSNLYSIVHYSMSGKVIHRAYFRFGDWKLDSEKWFLDKELSKKFEDNYLCCIAYNSKCNSKRNLNDTEKTNFINQFIKESLFLEIEKELESTIEKNIKNNF